MDRCELLAHTAFNGDEFFNRLLRWRRAHEEINVLLL